MGWKYKITVNWYLYFVTSNRWELCKLSLACRRSCFVTCWATDSHTPFTSETTGERLQRVTCPNITATLQLLSITCSYVALWGCKPCLICDRIQYGVCSTGSVLSRPAKESLTWRPLIEILSLCSAVARKPVARVEDWSVYKHPHILLLAFSLFSVRTHFGWNIYSAETY